MKVEDLMMREGQQGDGESEDEEYIHFSPMRFCRTDEKGSLADPGKYEQTNIHISYLSLIMN
jgi:hypothetical protein